MIETRRKHPRKRVYIPVECWVEGRTCPALAWTLGGGGLFLALSDDLPLGTELTVRFHPAAHLPMVEAKAKVRSRVAGQGVGIEFTEIAPEHRDMILLQIGHRMAEKPRFPRAPLAVRVEFEGSAVAGTSRNISVGGMFIETGQRPESAQISIGFDIGDGGATIRVKGQVRYAIANLGLGVEFVGLSAADRARIEGYVSKAGRAQVKLP